MKARLLTPDRNIAFNCYLIKPEAELDFSLDVEWRKASDEEDGAA